MEPTLQDIEEGIYAICELCNEEIPIKRLKAKPMARHCIDCQTKLENEQKLTGT